MHETTIPETVTVSGGAIIQAVAEFDALSSFVCRINGSQETPLDISILETGWNLYAAAFGDPTDENLTKVGLAAVVDRRSDAILAERLRKLIV